MKNYLLLLIPFFFVACYEDDDLGRVTTERHDLSDFTSLRLDGIGDVYLHPDNDYRLDIETHIEIQDEITFYIEDGELTIDEDLSNRQAKSLDHLDLHIYMPFLLEIDQNGVGDIKALEGWDADRLFLELDGVGNIDLRDIFVDRLVIRQRGVGDITLDGETNIADYYLQDVGDIHAFGMEANICHAELTGVGNIELWANEELDAIADGVGNIFYRGNASVTKSESTTSKVINDN